MAVDGLEESESQVYQPCLPHLFDMLSHKKIDDSKLDQSEMRNRPWDHMYFQVSYSCCGCCPKYFHRAVRFDSDKLS